MSAAVISNPQKSVLIFQEHIGKIFNQLEQEPVL